MEKRPMCQNNNCNKESALLAWGKWVCGKCYANKVKELNDSVWD